MTSPQRNSIVCFSHLRWQFVFQRPQHVMSRLAKEGSVIYWEEPVVTTSAARLEVRTCDASGVRVVTPHLPEGADGTEQLRTWLDELLAAEGPDLELTTWFYTPMMLPLARHLHPRCVVYDCMDELASFRFAPPELHALESELFERADVVFTGGQALFEAKRSRHANVHAFPSSVDRAHFGQARGPQPEPADQALRSGPRLGFFGVIDERMDLALVAHVAAAHPEWSVMMVGPVVKIQESELPRAPNLHWLGGKSYDELPAYLAGWDVALMPFAINESTEFISPTKTPEYLAGGKPVVSTPIKDVVRQYGSMQRVGIASTPDDFVAACEAALLPPTAEALAEVEAVLSAMSWDDTVLRMQERMAAVPASTRRSRPVSGIQNSGLPHYDTLVVGAGFAGSVLAERLARGSGERVLVVDRRPHVGGNAFDELDAAGVLIHRYGPHIFHTNSQPVVDYLSQFTEWHPYEHRVLASVSGHLVPIPINRTTLNRVFDLDLRSDAEAEAFLAERAEHVDPIRTAEDVVVSQVGRELYEMFFRGYTKKQWGVEPAQLDRSVTARIPTRTSTDDRYFGDRFQAMPKDGYTRMFENLLDHPGIEVRVGVDWETVRREVTFDRLVFTGPIDEYYGHRFGRLPYRSLSFRHETLDTEWHQPVAVVNYPAADVPHTRVTEYKHLTGQTHPQTSITYEVPSADGDPYYPIPCPETQALYRRYEALADAETHVTFAGRLGSYRYYNMDQVVAQALATYRKLTEAAETELLSRAG